MRTITVESENETGDKGHGRSWKGMEGVGSEVVVIMDKQGASA